MSCHYSIAPRGMALLLRFLNKYIKLKARYGIYGKVIAVPKVVI